MQKDFISHLKWTAHAQKAGFSSLSYNDKTTNEKLTDKSKSRENYMHKQESVLKVRKKISICKRNEKMWVVQDFWHSVYSLFQAFKVRTEILYHDLI